MQESDSRHFVQTVSLSLVIPAYNEEEVIEQAIDEATVALSQLVSDFEIIVVDDGSTDDTAAIVAAVAECNSHLRLLKHDSNEGYGAALRNGFAAAKNELIAFTDADCQFDLSEIDSFLLLAKRYDAVCGYRIDRKDTKLRCFYSLIYNWIVRLLLGIRVRDVDCALKVFRRAMLHRTRIQSDGFLVNSDLLTQIRDAGGSIVEVGVTHRPRAAGQSTVSIRHIPRVLASLVQFWWNEIQFPKREPTTGTKTELSNRGRFGLLQWALIGVACLFLFTNLSYPLIDRDETRYAEIPREMLVSGDWVLPTLNFKTYYDKPPMLYWLVASSFTVFGIDEWSARLVPAFAALGTLLLVIWFANRHFGQRIGLISGGVLMLTGGFAFCSRYLLIDGVLTLFTTASLMAAYEAVCDGQSKAVRCGWWITASVACGLGFMTKGPLSLVLMLPVILVFSWLTREVARIRMIHLLSLIAIVSLIALPWMIAVSLRDQTFLWEFFVNHNIRRFAGQYHDRPFWYFVPVLLAAGFPWSFLAIPFVRDLVTRASLVRDSRSPIIGFLSLWVVWMLVFFSVSRCKLPTYLLPTAPAFALLLATYLDRIIRPAEGLDAWERMAQLWSARMATIAGCSIGVGLIAYFSLGTEGFGVGMFAWTMVWGAILVCSLQLIGDRRYRQFAWGSSALLSFAILTLLLHQLVPSYSQTQKIFAAKGSTLIGVQHDDSMPVATIGHEFSEVPYYLNRKNVFNFSSKSDPGIYEFTRDHADALLVVRRDILIGEIQNQLPEGTRLQTLGVRGPARLLLLSKNAYQIAKSNANLHGSR
ncbi:MAG: glycosyltransferase [Phycisphaera sp. RhM]|nr:glycosyltransferase [Phycisphaera sp. RhM]